MSEVIHRGWIENPGLYWALQRIPWDPGAPVDILKRLAHSDDDHLARSVAFHSNCPPDVQLYLLERLLDWHIFEQVLLSNPEVLEDKLVPWSTSVNIWQRMMVAAHPSASTGVLEPLSNDQEPRVRTEVAKNLNTSLEVVEVLMSDPTWRVRRAVASRFDLPFHWLEHLSQDQDVEVRTELAENPITPVELLSDLSTDARYEVRFAVAAHVSARPRLLTSLAEDPHVWVQAAVASHPRTPLAVLQQLSLRQQVNVMAGLAFNPSYPQHLRDHLLLRVVQEHAEEEHLMQSIAEHPELPLEVLSELARQPTTGDTSVGAVALENPSWTPEALSNTLHALSLEDWYEPRLRAAKHPLTPQEDLVRLMQDNDDQVRRTVWENPNCPLPLEKVVQQDPEAIGYVLNNPACPLSLLQHFYQDEKWRAHVVLHPNFPAEQKELEYDQLLIQAGL